jgi:hypothetical protein
MRGAHVAHLLGVLLLTVGLWARVRRRIVLSHLCALFGVAVARLPDLFVP